MRSPRLGLCCLFVDEPIKFRTTTATSLLKLAPEARAVKLSALCLENAQALMAALQYCDRTGIGCFRVNSQILPVKTHPQTGYRVDDLPEAAAIVEAFRACGSFARARDIRTVFHPDQFVVINSNRPDVVEKSIDELDYQAEVAEWINADVLNVHIGGVYGDKASAVETFCRRLELLPDRARRRLTVENDDKSFAPADMIAACRTNGVPLVYDVHHHRCLADGLSVEEATEAALTTWDREPLFHISSPIDGWDGPKPLRHHDEIDPRDFPDCWRGREITVEVEAKAKERAVRNLAAALALA
ncbi:UV DNA damage repair endonuclease UvsE [Isosphaeraceae bacterium EP7]